MSVIFSIQVKNGSGRTIQRQFCGRTCYGPKANKTNCICEGVNFRVGKAQAINNSFEFCQVWFQDWLDEHAHEFGDDRYAEMTMQLPLSGLDGVPTTPDQ